MAIQKEVENEYGAKFDYHKIRDVRITANDKTGITLVITVDSYLDKDARINGKEPSIRQCIISGADFALTPFYALLKAKFPDFTGGKDDLNNDFKGEAAKPDPLFVVQNNKGAIDKWRESEVNNKEIKEND